MASEHRYSPVLSLCVVAVRCCFIVQDFVCGIDRQPFAVRMASDDLWNGLGPYALPSFRIRMKSVSEPFNCLGDFLPEAYGSQSGFSEH